MRVKVHCGQPMCVWGPFGVHFQSSLSRSLAGFKTLLARAHCPGLSKGLGPTTIDSAWRRYPLGISPLGYAAHDPSCHLPSPLLRRPHLVWCRSVPGTPSSPRSRDPSLCIGHPEPPPDDSWQGGDGAGGLPACGDSALLADCGVLPMPIGIRPEPHLCRGPLHRQDPRSFSTGHLGC